ncbi:hypothetical protein [Vagococcus fluvialis]|uniref:hypothetical protein n=1 Tax=Vagococcus fluvialis TaxID=2738 RepID=UPI001A8DF04A|nr:hypothetical protein [Vagococcus fluvialis]MBO0437818.1 hypothetical protein [Vagococcus fluvialis]
MYKQLKQNFIQTSLGSILWFSFLASLIFYNKTVPFNFLWHIIGIGLLFGITFGLVYPYFWKYATTGATTNIILSTIINLLCGLLGLYLFSTEMFSLITPYIWLVTLLTLIGHIIAFYFYSKHENKQQAKKLNQLLS